LYLISGKKTRLPSMTKPQEAIPALSAELVSDQVELDDYWSLKGDN